MAALAGVELEVPWKDLFKRYSQIAKPDAYPAIDEIQRAFDKIGDPIVVRFGELTDQELRATCPREFPVADKSLRAGLAFLVWHESYHIGQMGFLRKWLGYESLVG